jgi:hypothetical protein
LGVGVGPRVKAHHSDLDVVVHVPCTLLLPVLETVSGLGFGVQVSGLGFGVQVSGLGFGVQVLGLGCGLQVSGLGLGCRFRVSGL